MNIFEKASRKKYRFQIASYGSLSVEDLWGMPLRSKARDSLSSIAMDLYSKINESNDIPDFFDDSAGKPEQDEMNAKLDIIKHIISVRKEESLRASQAKTVAEQKALLVELLHEKKNEALKDLSVEELEARIKGM